MAVKIMRGVARQAGIPDSFPLARLKVRMRRKGMAMRETAMSNNLNQYNTPMNFLALSAALLSLLASVLSSGFLEHKYK